MAIKNKDGSTYSFSKPPQAMEQQTFWDKTEKIIFHNKFGEKVFREDIQPPLVAEPPQREVKIVDFKEVAKQVEDEIKIVQALEESKSKPLHEDIVEVWCLPCLEYAENVDELYGESYANVKYGEKFTFRARLLRIEDLHVEFVTETSVKLQPESVIYPKMKNRRWWKIKDMKEVKGYHVYLGMISDFQPAFVD